MKGFTKGLCSIFLVVLAACTEPGQMTGIGAATGGVVGAGLGAIVGNQTGDPGAGLALGAVAGAGAGAAVGNVLEAQDQAIRQQDEAIERQEQVIRAQRGEIDEMRRGNQDTTSLRFRAKPGYNASESRGHFGVKTSDKKLVLKNVPVKPPPPPQQNSFSHSVAVSPKTSRVASVTTVKSDKPAVSKKAAVIPESLPSEELHDDLTGSDAVAETEVSDIDSSVEEEVAPPVVAEIKKESAAPEVVAARVPPTSAKSSSDCLSAEEEYNQAAQKNETPDKLFHIRRALRLCPDDSRFHASLGDIYTSLKRSSDAQFEYQEALRLAPDNESLKQKVSAVKNNAIEPY